MDDFCAVERDQLQFTYGGPPSALIEFVKNQISRNKLCTFGTHDLRCRSISLAWRKVTSLTTEPKEH